MKKLSAFIRVKDLRLSAGLTLLEVMVSLSILMVGMTIMVTLAIASLQRNTANKERLQATQLADEGVEVVKYIRDKSTDWATFKTNYPISISNYCLYYDPGIGDWDLNDPADPNYCEGNPLPGFARSIIMTEPDADTRVITSTVTWQTKEARGINQTVTASTKLTSYKDIVAAPPPSDAWLAMASSDTREQHVAIWTGSGSESWRNKMIVWGGYRWGTGSLNTGGIYDPVNDTWSPISTSGAPGARTDFTAVWTGSKMIVWGGYVSGTGITNTGGVYDPATDSWSATSTTGAPLARQYHTAVWTGSKMIVWGGMDIIFNRLNTGGVYDPATNSWISTTTTGAPTGRSEHKAVWTGSKMIVWGGSNSSNWFNTGGVYDPVANSWTATSTTGAPAARDGHSAIWTGSKMVVWGGNDGTNAFNTGGQYDPVANSWTATSTTGAPDARYIHSAVWTGSKMIIWGGSLNAIPFNTGGQYDPVANSWTATSTTGAPSARYNHFAVWTGSSMIVFGGNPGNTTTTLGDGGIYDLP